MSAARAGGCEGGYAQPLLACMRPKASASVKWGAAELRTGRGAVVVIGALMTRQHVVVGSDVVLYVVVAVVQATFVVIALCVQ